jgi:hypothetical protein
MEIHIPHTVHPHTSPGMLGKHNGVGLQTARMLTELRLIALSPVSVGYRYINTVEHALIPHNTVSLSSS